MTFLGFLMLGAGAFITYCAARNLKPTCVITNVLQAKSGNCANS